MHMWRNSQNKSEHIFVNKDEFSGAWYLIGPAAEESEGRMSVSVDIRVTWLRGVNA